MHELYIPKHFQIYELVPKAFYNKHKSKGQFLWSILFDARLLMTIDTIREQFGAMTVNDWYWGGSNQYRGFRPPNCGVGATLSQHRFGRGCDLIPKEASVDDIRDEIINRQNYIEWKHVGGLEMDITWLHVDVRMRDAFGKIQLFYP